MRKNRTVLNLATEEATKLDRHPLSDDLEKRCVFSKIAGFQFCEEFLLLQLKCNLLGDGQDRAYSFRNVRRREDAAQRLHCIGKYPLRKPFTVLARNVHRFHHIYGFDDLKTISVFSRLMKAICDLN
jgi:hypothetical protein